MNKYFLYTLIRASKVDKLAKDVLSVYDVTKKLPVPLKEVKPQQEALWCKLVRKLLAKH